eukprot:5679557-Prymnesium_polylepis.1
MYQEEGELLPHQPPASERRMIGRDEALDDRGRHVWRSGRDEGHGSRDDRGRSESPPSRFIPGERQIDRGRSPP